MKQFILSTLLLLPLPIFTRAAEPTAEPGFTPLFDGKSLDGWQGGKDGYLVRDVSIVSQPKASGNLATIKE